MWFRLSLAASWVQTWLSAGPKVTPIPMVQRTAPRSFTGGCHRSRDKPCITLVCCEAHKTIKWWTVEMLTLISFDISEVWQSHFCSAGYEGLWKRGLTQVLKAKPFGRWSSLVSAHIFSSPPFLSATLRSLLPRSKMCAIQLFPARSLWKPALTAPTGRLQLDRVGGEAAVGNHLLAEGTDGANSVKMLVQQRSKRQKPEELPLSWHTAPCEHLAAGGLSEALRVKELISCFRRQGPGVGAQRLGNVKKWAVMI